jgi:hypothetical protein
VAWKVCVYIHFLWVFRIMYPSFGSVMFVSAVLGGGMEKLVNIFVWESLTFRM